MSEFNLFHYRTAVFYQMDRRFYKFLLCILYLQNLCGVVGCTNGHETWRPMLTLAFHSC